MLLEIISAIFLYSIEVQKIQNVHSIYKEHMSFDHVTIIHVLTYIFPTYMIFEISL